MLVPAGGEVGGTGSCRVRRDRHFEAGRQGLCSGRGCGSEAGGGDGDDLGIDDEPDFALRDHLIAEQVTCAVMEATGDYWKPFYYLLEDAGFELLLVNARHVKNLPSRKTDVSDAA